MKKLLLPIALLALMGQGCMSSAPTPTPVPVVPPTNVPAPHPTPTPMPPMPESSEQNMPPQDNTTPPPTPAPTPKPSASTYNVNIQNFAFAPLTVTVKKGDKVIFLNKDSAPHTATSDAKGFDSGMLAQGQSWTLDTSSLTAGTYAYHCSVHPMMKATLIVK